MDKTSDKIPEEFRKWATGYADGNSIDAHPKIREHLNAELYEAIINTYRHRRSDKNWAMIYLTNPKILNLAAKYC